MFKFFTIALILWSVAASAQPDTVYYNDKHLVTARGSATSFEVVTKLNDSNYAVSTYHVNPLWLQSTDHYKSLEPPLYHGESVHYYKNGDTVRGYYKMNMYTGERRDYYHGNTGDTLQAVYNLKDGKLQGSLISYYPNGKVKRRARYFDDRLMQGSQYDESGQEIKFTPYMTMPEPVYNVDKYLARNVKYPKKAIANNIEGRVIVRFVVDKSGKIRDVKVISYTPEILNNEALRVVNNMKPWQPGIIDDKPVDIYFTLPVLFQLQ